MRFGAFSGESHRRARTANLPRGNSECKLCIAWPRGGCAGVGALVRVRDGGLIFVLLVELAQLAPAGVLFGLSGIEVFRWCSFLLFCCRLLVLNLAQNARLQADHAAVELRQTFSDAFVIETHVAELEHKVLGTGRAVWH
jgi:hypothetical protein